jgi:hypothetical protein
MQLFRWNFTLTLFLVKPGLAARRTDDSFTVNHIFIWSLYQLLFDYHYSLFDSILKSLKHFTVLFFEGSEIDETLSMANLGEFRVGIFKQV